MKGHNLPPMFARFPQVSGGAQHKDGSLAGRSHAPFGRMDEVVRLRVFVALLIFCRYFVRTL